MKWRADGDGNVTDYYGYSSWGNRIFHDQYGGHGGLPIWVDGDVNPAQSMQQLKSGDFEF